MVWLMHGCIVLLTYDVLSRALRMVDGYVLLYLVMYYTAHTTPHVAYGVVLMVCGDIHMSVPSTTTCILCCSDGTWHKRPAGVWIG